MKNANIIKRKLKNGNTLEVTKQFGKYKVTVVSPQNAEISTKYSTDLEQATKDVTELKNRENKYSQYQVVLVQSFLFIFPCIILINTNYTSFKGLLRVGLGA